MTTKSFLNVLFFLLFLSIPQLACAAVQITEVMYDAPGADSGREWVEFANTGSASLDLTGFKFFEANTNHALTLLSGTGVLLPGAVGVIVQDQTKFLTDNPSFSGTLFQSSFSLSNTGEELGIKDSAGVTLDSVFYDAAAGAGGDGNALHRSGSSFVSGPTSPGVFAGGSSSQQTSPPSSAASSTTQSTSSAGSGPPLVSAEIDTSETSMVGGGTFFEGATYGSQNQPLSGARYLWNFGDGATGEGQRVFHAYSYPGTYEVVLSVGHNYSSATAKATVTATAAQVSLVVQADGSLSLFNNSASNLDVGLWSFVQGSSTFVLPEDTTVLAGKGVRFSPTITRLFAGPEAQLRYPNGALAARASLSADSPLRGEPVSTPVVRSTPVVSVSAGSTDFGDESATQVAPEGNLIAATAQSGASFPGWGYGVGLVALIVCGVCAVYYARAMTPVALEEETSLSADEFEIERT